ncbi:unnamed protein product [Peronospora destructor]|uniref:Uncharacterized protein n=1 Tax=Peronospora destructor TaxID=86335 RepID=A0AAV0T7B2_9STRA|nr:unnamed protein product [Peronospora destructor]
MSGGDGSSRAGRPPQALYPPDGPLPMSALAAPSPSEQAAVANRLGEVEEMKTEDGVDLTPTPSAGVVLPTAWTPEEAARRLEVRAKQDEEAAAAAAKMKRLYQIATTDYPLHEDTALQPMLAEEREALTAYVERRLELPGPPTFLHGLDWVIYPEEVTATRASRG